MSRVSRVSFIFICSIGDAVARIKPNVVVVVVDYCICYFILLFPYFNDLAIQPFYLIAVISNVLD